MPLELKETSRMNVCERPEKRSFFALCGVIALAFGLRWVGMGWGIPGQEHFAASYRSDEYTLFYWMRQMRPEVWDFNPHTYFNGTLLVYLLAAFYKALSFLNLVNLSESAAFYYQNVSEWAKIYWFGRLFMVGMGTATVWMTYQAAHAVFGKTTGLLAALLYAVIPLHVVSSKHMLVEPAATLWIAAFLFFCLSMLKSPALRNYYGAGFVVGSACAMKLTFFTLWGLLFLAHLLGRVEKLRWASVVREILDKKLWLSTAVAIISYFALNPYLLFNFQEAFQEITFYFRQYQQGWQYLNFNFIFLLTSVLPYGTGYALLFFTGCACFYAVFSKSKALWFVLLGFLLHLYLIAKSGTPVIKYYVIILPFLTILAGCFFSALISTPPRWRQGLAGLFFAGMIFEMTSLSLGYNKIFLHPDARDVASQWIRDQVKAGSKLAVMMEPYYQSPPLIYNQYFFTGKSKIWNIPLLYPVVLINQEEAALEKEAPDYVIISNRENRAFQISREDYPFLDDWSPLETRLKDSGYERIQVFKNRLGRNKGPFIRPFPPFDWDQILSEIRIYANPGAISATK